MKKIETIFVVLKGSCRGDSFGGEYTFDYCDVIEDSKLYFEDKEEFFESICDKGFSFFEECAYSHLFQSCFDGSENIDNVIRCKDFYSVDEEYLVGVSFKSMKDAKVQIYEAMDEVWF